MSVIELSTEAVPVSGALQRACCIPLAAVVQPMLHLPDEPTPSSHDPSPELLLTDIARCAGCSAYINRLCSFERHGWACSLCGVLNDYAALQNRRYLGGPEARSMLPELRPGAVEGCSPVREGEDQSAAAAASTLPSDSLPASMTVVALVDAAADPDHLELVRSSLLAGLEGLPGGARFGIVAFGGDEVALFDPAPGGPAVRHIDISPIDAAAPTAVEFAQALPLENLLAPVGRARRHIAAAIEAIHPMGVNAVSGVRTRPLGEALQAVLRLIGAWPVGDEAGSNALGGHAGARIVVFLSGPPNHGRGSVFNTPAAASPTANAAAISSPPSGGRGHGPTPFLMDPSYPELSSWHAIPPAPDRPAPPKPRPTRSCTSGWTKVVDGAVDLGAAAAEMGLTAAASKELSVAWDAAAAFYGEAASAAAALGVVVDIYAVCSTFVGLEAIRTLVEGTGGSLAIYPPPAEEDCALPQDLFKRLSEPFAFGALLRLRTSPELRVVGALGPRLVADPRSPGDLFQLACCHPHDAFGLELEHATRTGLQGTPVMQLVFQYLSLTPTPTLTQHGFVLQRRTRIVTQMFPVATTAPEVYAGVSAGAHIFALLHRLCAVADSDSVESARAVLLERTVELTAAHHSWAVVGEPLPKKGAAWRRSAALSPVDASLKECEALHAVPRAAYSLLRGPLFNGAPRHPDVPCALRVLWDTLSPDELRTAIYPHLSSWATPDQVAFPRHSLSRAALALSRQPIYLLDAYHSIVIFYTAPEDKQQQPEAQFPPPHSSYLRSHVSALTRARHLTPRVMVVRDGDDDRSGGGGTAFFRWLIEDHPARPGDTGLGTFLEFLGQVRELVVELLEE